MKFQTKKVSQTKKNFKVLIPYKNLLTIDSKGEILDSIIKIPEAGLNLSFDNELNEISFTSDTIDLGRIIKIDSEKNGKLVPTSEAIIEMSKKLEEKALKYSRIIDLKKLIYQGKYTIKTRVELLTIYLSLKEYSIAKTEIYLLILDLHDKNKYEDRLILNYCRLLNQLIDSSEDDAFEVSNVKEVFYMQLILEGENIEYYPELLVVPILEIDGVEKEMDPIYNNGLIKLSISEIQKPINLKIRIHYKPELRDDKQLIITDGKTISKQGYSYNGIIYNEFSIKLNEDKKS